MSILGIWLAIGCGAHPAEPAPDDLAERFATEPERVIAEVVAMDDAVAQGAAVLAISDAHPGAVGPLCTELPPGPTADRCHRYASRAHLWTAPSTEAPPAPAHPALPPGRTLLMTTERTARGPAELRRALPERPAHELDLTEVAADPGGCSVGDRICLEEAATRAARVREATTAASRCRALPQEHGRADCAFRAAEVFAQVPSDYASGVALCRLAEGTEPECHGHVLLHHGALPGTRLVPDGLHLATQTADAITAHWAPVDPDFGAFARDLFWASYLTLVPDRRTDTVLAARALLPADAGPHLNDLLAYAALGAEDPLRSLLALHRAPVELPPPPHPDSLHHGTLWQWDLPGEEALDASILPANLGGRRPTSDDPELDLQLALLELTGRGPAASLPEALSTFSTEVTLLRWGVARVLQQRLPTAPQLTVLLDDPDPLVAARAKGEALAPSRPPLPAEGDRRRERRE